MIASAVWETLDKRKKAFFLVSIAPYFNFLPVLVFRDYKDRSALLFLKANERHPLPGNLEERAY